MPMAPISILFLPGCLDEDNIPTVHFNVKYKAIFRDPKVSDNTKGKDLPIYSEWKDQITPYIHAKEAIYMNPLLLSQLTHSGFWDT